MGFVGKGDCLKIYELGERLVKITRDAKEVHIEDNEMNMRFSKMMLNYPR
ncbi:MAG: hypothetical protein QXE67_04170 [Nitrososphaerota archaeon]